ncbi:MAG: hypothetical protein ACOC56_01730 [Atribacterota bacterium]
MVTNNFEKHALSLGKLWGNLLGLEAIDFAFYGKGVKKLLRQNLKI